MMIVRVRERALCPLTIRRDLPREVTLLSRPAEMVRTCEMHGEIHGE